VTDVLSEIKRNLLQSSNFAIIMLFYVTGDAPVQLNQIILWQA